MLFGFDAFIAFLIVCLMLYLMVAHMAARAHNALAQQDALERERIAMAAADILVKDSNAIGGIGCARYDAELHRIEENVIEKELCGSANLSAVAARVAESGNLLKEVSLQRKEAEGEILFSQPAGGNGCVSAERFVAVKSSGVNDAGGSSAKLRVVVCGG